MKVSSRKAFVWLVLLASSLIYNFYLLKIPVNMYDEGIILAGAERVLRGDLPYVDFWSMYPPGQYYTVALLFKIFGESVLTERVYDLIIRSMLALLIFLLIKKLCSSSLLATLGWLMALILLGSFGLAGYPVYIAIGIVLIAAYLFLHYLEVSKEYLLIYSGVFIVFSALFRHDLAGYAAISLLLTLLLKKKLDQDPGIASILHFFIGVLLIGLPMTLFLSWSIGIDVIVDQLLFTPGEIMKNYRWLPYPINFSLKVIQFYVYPLVLIIGFLLSWVFIAKYKIRDRLIYGMFYVSLSGILFLNQALIRSDFIHLLPCTLLSIVTGCCLASVAISSSKKAVNPHYYRSAAYVVLFAVFVPLVGQASQKIKSINEGYFSVSRYFDRSGYAVFDNKVRELILYIENQSDRNDSIFVGVLNHDQHTISHVAIYFLANRRYSSKYHELHPGVVNTPKVQSEIVHELKSTSPKLIVLGPGYWYEPNDTVLDSGVDCLDNYIRVFYDKKRIIGPYEVWLRKSQNSGDHSFSMKDRCSTLSYARK